MEATVVPEDPCLVLSLLPKVVCNKLYAVRAFFSF